jgi:hypothetical protein
MFDVNNDNDHVLTDKEVVSNGFGMGTGGNDSTSR